MKSGHPGKNMFAISSSDEFLVGKWLTKLSFSATWVCLKLQITTDQSQKDESGPRPNTLK